MKIRKLGILLTCTMVLFFVFSVTNFSYGEDDESKTDRRYSTRLFPEVLESIDVFYLQKNDQETKKTLKLRPLRVPHTKEEGKSIMKFSELKAHGKTFSKYYTVGYFLTESSSSYQNLVMYKFPTAGLATSDLSGDVVWHPGRKKIFVVLLNSSGPVHDFELYKFDTGRKLKPFPFTYDSYDDWPSSDKPEKTIRRTTGGHPCSFTDVEMIAEENGLLLYCRRAKEECPDQYYRYDFKRGTLKEAEVKEQK